ncbi:hypothetical protein D5P06_06085 [Salmonella enterica subsp. enterica serovar Agbeni]|nr:hypothetical protein [Salmonella enterica subsp. enterica serovar Agbeni]EEI9689269.1 hypothetical protein [Salmonella enterica subsp. enterica serovar Hillingdon]EHG8445187.1 hypothetical protein [Salmonella enterica subsp. enterica]EKY8002553.1 hypothetical protein [Salmonella enterica]EBW3019718.1 hypothetical protein [Salmonella enterica subsp. enterica serovar Agbeni]
MNTITINTYDPEARFDMTQEEAKGFFEFVAKKAEEQGYEIKYECSNYVDEESERFVEECFKEY